MEYSDINLLNSVNVDNNVVNVDTIILATFNMRGFKQGIMEVDEMLRSNNYVDILLLQEHWLTGDQLNNFNKYENNIIPVIFNYLFIFPM